MFRARNRMAPVAALAVTTLALVASPAALATPTDCQTTDTTVVCEGPGSAGASVAPSPAGESDGSGQNGPYGPAGAHPPVGGN